MELLPIVYISLAVFAVIAVVVIIVSYISFKIRQKFGDNTDEEIIVDLKPSTVSPAKKAIDKKIEERKKRTKSRRESKIKIGQKKKKQQVHSHKRTTMNRIEIINPSKPSKESDLTLTKKILDHEDSVLKHYSDEDDDDFYTIKGTHSD